MEDVDNIIIVSLNDIGCDIDPEVKSIKELLEKPDTVLKCVIASLEVVSQSEGKKYPRTAPRGMSQKVALGTELASAIKTLGYKADISYHQLLYPNEADTRKILLYLIEKFPAREDDGSGDGGGKTLDPKIIFRKSIEDALIQAQRGHWNPSACTSKRPRDIYKFRTHKLDGPYLPGPRSSRYKGLETYIRQHQKYITGQPSVRQDVIPSIIEYNSNVIIEIKEAEEERRLGLQGNQNERKNKKNKLMKLVAEWIHPELNKYGTSAFETLPPSNFGRLGKTRFQHDVEYTYQDFFGSSANLNPITVEPSANIKSKEETEQELAEKRKKALEELDENLRKCKDATSELEKEFETLQSNIRQLEANIVSETAKSASLEEKYRQERKVADLIPNAPENIKQLTLLKQQGMERVYSLAKEWENHRKGLIEEYRKLKAEMANRQDDSQWMFEKIQEMRRTMQEINEDITHKREKFTELQELLSQMPKDVNRAYYTRRILENVKNVKKQKLDINKILIDTRNLKKEINTISDTLQRTFSVNEEVIYQDATKDVSNTGPKQIYKDIVAINDAFKKLIEQVEDTGRLRNEILDLEAKVETVQLRTNSLNMDRLLQDLREVKKENMELTKRAEARQK